MKKTVKLLIIIDFIALIGFSMTACLFEDETKGVTTIIIKNISGDSITVTSITDGSNSIWSGSEVIVNNENKNFSLKDTDPYGKGMWLWIRLKEDNRTINGGYINIGKTKTININ